MSALAVLLADADPLQRQGWRLLVEAQPDLRVVAEAADGVGALAALRRTAVDVALVDVRMPRMSGLQVVRTARDDARVRVAQSGRAFRAVLVTATDLDRHAVAALEAGATAVLWKDARPETLLDALRSAAGAAVAG